MKNLTGLMLVGRKLEFQAAMGVWKRQTAT